MAAPVYLDAGLSLIIQIGLVDETDRRSVDEALRDRHHRAIARLT